MSDSSRPVKTNQVDGVLQNYLDQLLISATEQPIAEVVQPVPVVKEPAVVTQEKATTELLVETPVTEVDALTLKQATNNVSPKTPLAALNGSSTQDVECLIFKVAGIKSAIPLRL